MAANVIVWSDVEDPKHDSINIREVFRGALRNRDVASKVAAIVGNGEDYGHKVLIWDAALAVVEEHVGDAMQVFDRMTRYEKAVKMRVVYRERVALNKKWQPEGIAARIAEQKAAQIE